MRAEKSITITDGGKDKTFRIKQMSAVKAQRWLFKLILLIGGNTNIGGGDEAWGNILSGVADKPYDKVEELLNELTACCTAVLDEGRAFQQLSLSNADSFIEDMGTLMQLQKEAFTLNDFFGGIGMNGLNTFQGPEIPTIKRQK